MTDHLAFVRSHGCIVGSNRANDRCFGRIEAHHVRTAANSGMGMKPPDSATAGLCQHHHRKLHRVGRLTFEAAYCVDLAAEARRLAALDTPAHQELPMNDNAPANVTTMPDPTLDVLRERVHRLNDEIIRQTQAAHTTTAIRDELVTIIEALTRKQRVSRKPRQPATLDTPPATLDGALAALGQAVANDTAPREEEAA